MQVPRKQAVEIDFRNISYSVGRKKSVHILKNINGHFSSGNLVGILGPSGAGKSSLLNILAGFIADNRVRGEIKINGKPRDTRKFKKLSCYLMQQDVLQHQLSVMELMMLAADLKLGSSFTKTEKYSIINTVMGTIGLGSCLETRTENLSGGQTKRLAIALELISNPPVMFLDEPTTGLDNVVAKQCIELLKTLANQGRTIICTIHQPPNSLLNFFDQVYFMANGCCVYSGSISQTVPFLEMVGMACPTYYNPADYIIELTNNNEHNVKTLSKATDNGVLTRLITAKGRKTEQQLHKATTADNLFSARRPQNDDVIPNSYGAQVSILCRRMFVQGKRNKLALAIQLIHHVLSSLSVGFSFYGIGDDASQIFANYKFIISVIVFYCYTYIMSPILLFPFEIELIRREYFNGWYSVKAYYTALTLSNIPQTTLFSVIFNVIIYTLTDQPMDVWRFVLFNVICILVSLISYGLGIAIGSVFDSIAGACLGSAIGFYLIAMSIHGMGYGDTITTLMKVLTLTTYARHSLIALCTALFQNRPAMKCNADFCYIQEPEDMLRLMGMGDPDLRLTIALLVVFLVVHKMISYTALKWRVSTNSMHLFQH